MSWSDKSVSPCVWTPMAADAGGMALDAGLLLTNGRIEKALVYTFFRLKITQCGTAEANRTVVGYIQLFDENNNQITPTDMTNYSQNGFVVTEGTVVAAGHEGHKLFNSQRDYPTSFDISNVSASERWVKIQIPTAKKCKRFVIWEYNGVINNSVYAPQGFDLEASVSGAFVGEQTTLLSVSGQVWTTDVQSKEFTI